MQGMLRLGFYHYMLFEKEPNKVKMVFYSASSKSSVGKPSDLSLK